MGRDDAQRAARQADVDDDGAARLHAGQGKLMGVGHHALPEQQDVAMPAMVLARPVERHGHQAAFMLQPVDVDQAGALAEPLVGLLQRHHIRIQLADDGQVAARIEAPVEPDALVNVVGGDRRVGVVGMRYDVPWLVKHRRQTHQPVAQPAGLAPVSQHRSSIPRSTSP